MNFEEFINTVKDTIKDYLPENYRDAEVNILENRKLNTNYTGLTVTREGDTLAPTINLNNLFDSYSKHTGMQFLGLCVAGFEFLFYARHLLLHFQVLPF